MKMGVKCKIMEQAYNMNMKWERNDGNIHAYVGYKRQKPINYDAILNTIQTD